MVSKVNVFDSVMESGTSRIYKHLTGDSVCAIISPYRGEYSLEENKQRMKQMKSKVRSMGYGFTQFISRWVEDGENFDEESLMIIGIPENEAMKLSKEYEQSSFIYKDADKCVEICSTPFETYSVGDVVRTYNNVGNGVLNIQDAEDIFSKRKGGPASMPVKGSGKKRPFTLTTLGEVLEVEQPCPSTFSGYRYRRIF